MPNFDSSPADAVQGDGAPLDETQACAVHHQARLLLFGLDRHEAHGRALNRFADGRGIGRVALGEIDSNGQNGHGFPFRVS